ncbi:MAG: DNA primase [Saprospiraceae bacterium]|nr:DNA primase [Saprospiraceae bacterium]
MISRKSIDQVIDTARIDELAREYVDLRQRGANLIGLCPFHKEKTPSFYVSPQKNIFKCFGCGKGGTPVQFVMEAEQLSFPEAIRSLAKRYHISLEETERSPETTEEDKLKESLYILNQFALDHYVDNLWNTNEGQTIGLAYFRHRGLTDDTIKKFDLGFAPDLPDALYKKSQQAGFQKEFLGMLGLANDHDRDFFRDRVIFPIHAVGGRCIAFAGRIMTPESKVAKYINSPESSVYQKSKTLYGLHLARRSIREQNRCILVEGYIDVIALSQAGFENVVASSGTSLTEEQIHAIKRITSNILLLYDGDPAGIKAATRGMDMILQEGLNVKIALIPDREDPDSYLKKVGTDAFGKFLNEQSVDFIMFRLTVEMEGIQGEPLKKAQVASEIVRSISKIPDPIQRAVYLRETSDKTGIDESSLIDSCNRFLQEDRRIRSFRMQKDALERDKEALADLSSRGHSAPKQGDASSASDAFQEKDLCRVLMLFGDRLRETEPIIPFAQYIIDNIIDTLPLFEDATIRRVIEETELQLNEGNVPGLQYFIGHESQDIANLALEFTMSKFEYSSNWSDKMGIYLLTQKEPEENALEDIRQAILRFKLKKYNKFIAELEKKLKEAQYSEEELELELKSLQHIVIQRNEIAAMLRTVII